MAGLSAASVNALGLFREAIGQLADNRTEGAESLFRNLSKTIGKSGNTQELNRVISLIGTKPTGKNGWWQSEALLGLSETVPKEIGASLSKSSHAVLKGYFKEATEADVRSNSMALLNEAGYFDNSNDLTSIAKQVALDTDVNALFRADAIKVLAWSDADGNSQLFQSLLTSEAGLPVRQQALESLKSTSGTQVGDFLIEHWKQLSPKERDLAVDVFSTSPERQIQLLRAVESNQLQSSVIGWRRIVRLLNSRNVQVRELARAVLEGNETISDSVWQQYQEVLTLNGDPIKGAAEFGRSCALCHQISGEHGTNYGPDLAAVKNRNKSGIMIDILKPKPIHIGWL